MLNNLIINLSPLKFINMNILDPSKKSVDTKIKLEADFSKGGKIDLMVSENSSFDIIVNKYKRKKLINGNFETESLSNIHNDNNDNMTCSDAGEFVVESKNKDTNINYNRKAKVTKETVKRYKVIIKYIEVDDSQRKIKRAIIEDILKNS